MAEVGEAAEMGDLEAVTAAIPEVPVLANTAAAGLAHRTDRFGDLIAAIEGNGDAPSVPLLACGNHAAVARKIHLSLPFSFPEPPLGGLGPA